MPPKRPSEEYDADAELLEILAAEDSRLLSQRQRTLTAPSALSEYYDSVELLSEKG